MFPRLRAASRLGSSPRASPGTARRARSGSREEDCGVRRRRGRGRRGRRRAAPTRRRRRVLVRRRPRRPAGVATEEARDDGAEDRARQEQRAQQARVERGGRRRRASRRRARRRGRTSRASAACDDVPQEQGGAGRAVGQEQRVARKEQRTWVTAPTALFTQGQKWSARDDAPSYGRTWRAPAWGRRSSARPARLVEAAGVGVARGGRPASRGPAARALAQVPRQNGTARAPPVVRPGAGAGTRGYMSAAARPPPPTRSRYRSCSTGFGSSHSTRRSARRAPTQARRSRSGASKSQFAVPRGPSPGSRTPRGTAPRPLSHGSRAGRLQEREPHALQFYGRSGKLLRVTIHSCASDVLACECLQAALHTLVIGAGIRTPASRSERPYSHWQSRHDLAPLPQAIRLDKITLLNAVSPELICLSRRSFFVRSVIKHGDVPGRPISPESAGVPS